MLNINVFPYLTPNLYPWRYLLRGIRKTRICPLILKSAEQGGAAIITHLLSAIKTASSRIYFILRDVLKLFYGAVEETLYVFIRTVNF